MGLGSGSVGAGRCGEGWGRGWTRMAIKLLKPNVDYAVDNETESVCSFLI